KKAFFFFLYDGQRQWQRQSVTSRVLTADARDGNFRYFPGIRNGNATSTTPSVDLNGNLTLPASQLRSFGVAAAIIQCLLRRPGSISHRHRSVRLRQARARQDAAAQQLERGRRAEHGRL